MPNALKYIVDERGQKTSVLVPIKVCEELNGDFKKLQAKLDVFSSVQAGLREVKAARKNGKQLQTLKDFLKRV